MKIEIIDLSILKSENTTYNSAIRLLLKNLFQTENEGVVGYIQSTEEDLGSGGYNQISSQQKIKIIPENTVIADKKGALVIKKIKTGPAERNLLNNLFNSEYTTIIMTGAWGSGKTAIIKYIQEKYEDCVSHTECENYKDCKTHKVNFLYYNFNEYVSYREKDLLDELVKDINEKIKGTVQDLLSNESIFKDFLESLRNGNGHKNLKNQFNGFRRKILAGQAQEWKKLNQEQKIDEIINWIESDEKELRLQNKKIFSIISFVYEKHINPRRGCQIMVFDNLDGILDEAQTEIVNYILRLVEKSGIKVLIPVRLTTFGKIVKNNQGSFAFHVLQHIGGLPIRIIGKRIKHYLDNKDSDTYKKWKDSISEVHEKELEKRLNDVLFLIENKAGERFRTAFSALAGNSIKRGLELIPNAFINYSLSYKGSAAQDSLIRAILVGENESGLLDCEDRLITNLFTLFNEAGSLLSIRMLGILNVGREKKKKLYISELLDDLKKLSDWSTEIILYTLNTLMNYEKRLVYVDGVSAYKDVEHLIKSGSDEICISFTGREYLEHLCGDLTYLQNCFYAIDWNYDSTDYKISDMKLCEEYLSDAFAAQMKTEGRIDVMMEDKLTNILEFSKIIDVIPQKIDSTTLFDRLSLIRKGLQYFLLIDLTQVLRFYSFIKPNKLQNGYDLINQIFTNNLISKAGRSVFYIIKHDMQSTGTDEADIHLYQEEINDWKNLCLIGSLVEQLIFERQNRDLEILIEAFTSIA